MNDWDFPAFLKKYPITEMKVGSPVISEKHFYAGLPDIQECVFDGKRSLADVKRTPDKFKNFKQIAAYIMAAEEMGLAPYEQMIIIPSTSKTEQGFSKPIVSTEISQFKAAFLQDRENFRKRFGV